MGDNLEIDTKIINFAGVLIGNCHLYMVALLSVSIVKLYLNT